MANQIHKDILRTISSFIQKAFFANLIMNDDPAADIKPEYLTTVSICLNYSEIISTEKSSHVIRMEEPTASVLGSSALPPRTNNFSDLVTRPGQIDIVLYKRSNSFDRPIIIIETKKYISGFSGIKDDIIRNNEFLVAENLNNCGSIAIAISTFYWHEARGVTASEHENKSKKSFENIEKKIKSVASNNIDIELIRLEVYSSAFKTEEEANETDEYGQPAYLSEEPLTIYGGIVMLSRDDRSKWLNDIPTI